VARAARPWRNLAAATITASPRSPAAAILREAAAAAVPGQRRVDRRAESALTHGVRVELRAHLRTLAGSGVEVNVTVPSPVTTGAVLDALESSFPVLAGTMRDHGTLKRRPFVRFFACGEDVSLISPNTPLPDDIVSGKEPFLVIGAIAGG